MHTRRSNNKNTTAITTKNQKIYRIKQAWDQESLYKNYIDFALFIYVKSVSIVRDNNKEPLESILDSVNNASHHKMKLGKLVDTGSYAQRLINYINPV